MENSKLNNLAKRDAYLKMYPEEDKLNPGQIEILNEDNNPETVQSIISLKRNDLQKEINQIRTSSLDFENELSGIFDERKNKVSKMDNLIKAKEAELELLNEEEAEFHKVLDLDGKEIVITEPEKNEKKKPIFSEFILWILYVGFESLVLMLFWNQLSSTLNPTAIYLKLALYFFVAISLAIVKIKFPEAKGVKLTGFTVMVLSILINITGGLYYSFIRPSSTDTIFYVFSHFSTIAAAIYAVVFIHFIIFRKSNIKVKNHDLEINEILDPNVSTFKKYKNSKERLLQEISLLNTKKEQAKNTTPPELLRLYKELIESNEALKNLKEKKDKQEIVVKDFVENKLNHLSIYESFLRNELNKNPAGHLVSIHTPDAKDVINYFTKSII